jgi:CheY-like chemotaxis protein
VRSKAIIRRRSAFEGGAIRVLFRASASVASARKNVSRLFGRVKTDGSSLAPLALHFFPTTRGHRPDEPPMILILSDDAVAAALLGALIETLGYDVRFPRPPEGVDQTMRRVRPKVCLLDCDDPAACTDELLGRTMMRGISVVIFGTPTALERVRALAMEHAIDTLLVPPDPDVLDATLRRALRKADERQSLTKIRNFDDSQNFSG